MMRKRLVVTTLMALVFMMYGSEVIAQTSSGKVTGKVVDRESGEPLVGANILLVNTSLGAASDVEGDYTILNVVPGTYSVRVSYVGYQSQVIEDVRVVAGVTKELDIRLSATAVEVGDVIITAERKFFEEKATNDVRVYDSKEVNSLPVKGVEKVLSVQAGVVTAEGSGGVSGNATVNIRGGRGGEVLYVVDGVPQNDLLTGTNYSQVSTHAIEQVSFQIGGYEAKYGQAQSGVVNVTTKTGSPTYNIFGDVVTSTFTDDYGYNLYTGTIAGPFIPGNSQHTLFGSIERGYFADKNPSAIGLIIPSVGIDQKQLPHNSSSVWRWSARTYHDLDFITLRLGANVNDTKERTYTHRYAKNAADHNPRIERKNQSFTARLSKTFSDFGFINVNLGYRQYRDMQGDGVHFDQLERYGDPAFNPVTQPGTRASLDEVGIFFASGRVFNSFTKTRNQTYTIDADMSVQVENHLIEVGGGYQINRLRYYSIGPLALAKDKETVSLAERSRNLRPYFFGYDVTGQRETSTGEVDPVSSPGENIGPKKPIIAYGYIQDRYELKDLVLNLGLRFDYFDTKADILRDERLPYVFGDPTKPDPADFTKAKSEFIFSPRIGIGFPVTPTTFFHAQFGKFVQQPRLVDVYTNVFNIERLIQDQNLGINTGRLISEQTTQYELGLRQILGQDAAAMNITLFYKNTRDLVNTTTRFFFRQEGGQELRYYGPSNSDFGTVKGVAFTLQTSRIKNLFISVNYTFSFAEGTGSSTNSSLIATFRNVNGEVPIVIAPLDFDQRHTGTVNIGFNTGKDEMGILENVSANLLATFASGRPYTPLLSQNLLAGTSNYGDTRGYVNSATGPGNFSVNLKVEKSFYVGHLGITPYVWIENLFDATNPVLVYQSTGDPYTTGYLSTPEGQANAQSRPNYASDYMAFERDPANFGIPRQIRLGVKVNFGGFTL